MSRAARKSQPAVPAIPVISEAEITRYSVDLAEYKEMKKKCEAMEKDVKAREAEIIARMDAGAKVDSNAFDVAVDRSTTRRTPAWKEEFVKRLGQAEAEAVVQSTPEKVYPKLVVSAR